jgi:hypothetical protein
VLSHCHWRAVTNDIRHGQAYDQLLDLRQLWVLQPPRKGTRRQGRKIKTKTTATEAEDREETQRQARLREKKNMGKEKHKVKTKGRADRACPVCTQNSAYAERPTYKRRGLHIPSVPHIYKQQAVESCYFICQIKNGPSNRAIAEASFDFKPDGQSPDSPNRGSYM